MKLTLQAVERLLLDANGLPPSAEKAFRSRLGHLQRMGFPTAAKVGQFKRASYGIDELVQLSTLFALVQAYVPPVVARRVVLSFWPEIARLFITAAAHLGIWKAANLPEELTTVMSVLPSALATIGSDDRTDGRGGVDQGSFEVVLGEVPTAGTVGPGAPEDRMPVAAIRIDFVELARQVADAAGEPMRAHLDEAISDLSRRFGW